MSITIRGSGDENLNAIKEALEAYVEEHPDAEIELYRRNSISVRIRVIDPSLSTLGIPDRHTRFWTYLEKLPEELQSDISMLVLLAPGEVNRSMANLEFEDPSPSLIQ